LPKQKPTRKPSKLLDQSRFDRGAFDRRVAADYLSLSQRALDELVHVGVIRPLAAPSVRDSRRPTRRVLIAKADLDALIESWRARP
jgi:hypothetical protein